jgi:hypothetical protein
MRGGREVSEDDSELETELDEELLEVSSESESESLDNEEECEEDGSSRFRLNVLVFEPDTYGREAVDDCFNFLCVSFVSLNIYIFQHGGYIDWIKHHTFIQSFAFRRRP